MTPVPSREISPDLAYGPYKTWDDLLLKDHRPHQILYGKWSIRHWAYTPFVSWGGLVVTNKQLQITNCACYTYCVLHALYEIWHSLVSFNNEPTQIFYGICARSGTMLLVGWNRTRKKKLATADVIFKNGSIGCKAHARICGKEGTEERKVYVPICSSTYLYLAWAV